MTEDESEAEEESASIPLSELKENIEEEADPDEEPQELFQRESPPKIGETDASPPSVTDDDQTAPLSSLQETVADRRDEGRGSLSEETLFVEEDVVSPVEKEAVWADLLLEDEDNAEGLLAPSDIEEGGEYQIVSKNLCHRCEYFADPPDLRCTHEGTTIHQAVDMEHYRVSECPMVEDDSTDDPEA